MDINSDVEKGKEYYKKARELHTYEWNYSGKYKNLMLKSAKCGYPLAYVSIAYDSTFKNAIKEEVFSSFYLHYKQSKNIDGIIELLDFYFGCMTEERESPFHVDVLGYLSYLETCALTERQLDTLSRIISGNNKCGSTYFDGENTWSVEGRGREICLKDITRCSDEVMYSHLFTLAKQNCQRAEIILSIVYLSKEVKYFIPLDDGCMPRWRHGPRYCEGCSAGHLASGSEFISSDFISAAVMDSNLRDVISIIDKVVKRFIDYNKQTVGERGNIKKGMLYYEGEYQVLLIYAHYLMKQNDYLYAGSLFGVALDLLRKRQESSRNGENYGRFLNDIEKEYIINFSKEIGYTQYMCGLCYEQGKGVKQDIEAAVHYYRQASDLGYTDAQAALGICYALGTGVPRNEDKARELLTLAAKGDNVRALQFLDEHPQLKSGVRDVSYHAGGDIIQGNRGIIAKDDAVVNRANVNAGDTSDLSGSGEYKFCMYCGAKLPAEAMFCMKCGKQV